MLVALLLLKMITSEREARSEFLLIYTKNLSMSYISGTVSPIDKQSSLVGNPIPSAVYRTNAESCQCLLWRVARATWGMSQMFRLLFLGNGWADCVAIWHAFGDPLVTAYAEVTGEVCAHVQTYPHTALLYLGNGLVDCVQIWYVGWGSLTKCLPQVMDGVHLHVRTCAPLFHKCSPCCFSITAGPIALKFGMHLGNH